jgi:quinoprotein glucose dehydrogenase
VPQTVQLAAIDAIAALELQSAAPALVAAVNNEKAPEAVRSAALKALDGFAGNDVLGAVAAAEKSSVPSLRLAALQIVAHRAPEKALPVIKRFVTSGSEDEQRAAFAALSEIDSPQASALLVSALDQLAAGKVQPGAQVELLEAVSKSSAPTVKARWEQTQAVWTSSKDPLAAYGFALKGGNPRRGAEEFFGNAVLPCARCHRVGGDGGEAGPALTRIGAQHPPEYLLESVVKPSAHIAPGFDLVTFTLNDGSTESGSVVSESATGIVIKRGDGSQATLDPRQVKQRVTAPSSMPEIYGQMLTRTQLRDVVAFLKAQDGSRSQQGGAEEGLGASNRAMQSAPKEGPAGGHP